MKAVWRVMVPVYYNDGRRIPDRVHLEWQDEVVKISRGWTMHATALGAWLEDGASLPLIEDMRPVDILCTEEQHLLVVRQSQFDVVSHRVLPFGSSAV